MRHAILFGFVALAVAAGFACSSSSTVEDTSSDGGAPSTLPTSDPASTTPEGPAGTGANTGLPCDVQAVLENRCLTCHDGSMAGVAPLLTYSNLMAKAVSDPTKTLAQLSLERMKSATQPMPPKPAEAVSADEIADFEAWITGGAKKGEACTTPPPATDGGSMPSGDAGTKLPDGGSLCTSGTFWTQGNQGSGLMNPGQICQGCHQVMGGPSFSAAGTVYAGAHEPNNCNGANTANLTVIITDAQNREVRIPVNAAGNFYTRTRIRAPFKARVTDGQKTRAMQGSVTRGDCNGCHTENGANGAPGRIQAP